MLKQLLWIWPEICVRVVSDVFTNATLVTDHFHVVKLAMEAMQHLRVKKRWEELDVENEAYAKARKSKKNMFLLFYKMEIHLNNYWQDAGIFL